MTDCKELQEDGGWWEDILVNRCSFPIAPINTFTNIAYVIAGLVIWRILQTPASFTFFLVMTFLGFGSAYYHGLKTKPAGKLDDDGMYAVFTALTVYTLNPHYHLVHWFMLVIASLVVWKVSYSKFGGDLVHMFLGFFTATIVLKLLMTNSWLYGIGGLGILGIAYLIWLMDQKRTFWLPRWGHGIWHLLTAIGISILFLGVK